jgi:hypothetical protein
MGIFKRGQKSFDYALSVIDHCIRDNRMIGSDEIASEMGSSLGKKP